MTIVTLARFIGLGRAAIGLAFMVAPGQASRLWTGSDADEPGLKMLAVSFGARDLAIGLGTFLAARQGQQVARWLQVGALSDAADASATLLHGAQTPHGRRTLITILASGAAVGGAALARVGSRKSEVERRQQYYQPTTHMQASAGKLLPTSDFLLPTRP